MKTDSRKRVLLVQPSLQPPGGGNGVAAWMLEALKDEYSLTALVWDPVELAPINDFFGTSLEPHHVEVIVLGSPARRLLDRSPTTFATWKHYLLMQHARRRRRDHDVLISCNNESDLGGSGIQYIHFPRFVSQRPSSDLHWWHGSRSLVELYFALATRLTGFSIERMKKNVTLVNSDWTGRLLTSNVKGIEPRTVHPPAPGAFASVPWEKRANDFVCVGRLSPEKRIELLVEIVGRIRGRFEDAHLHIVGTPDDSAYSRRIVALAAENASWVHVHGSLPRRELERLLVGQRYGIHAMEDEHFGMAVAEMTRAGCIVFVPDDGGQVEIVGSDPRLLYRTADQAVERIEAVMENPALQAEHRANLAARAERLSAEHFAEVFRRIVRDAQELASSEASRE